MPNGRDFVNEWEGGQRGNCGRRRFSTRLKLAVFDSIQLHSNKGPSEYYLFPFLPFVASLLIVESGVLFLDFTLKDWSLFGGCWSRAFSCFSWRRLKANICTNISGFFFFSLFGERKRGRMMRLWITSLQLAELFVSSMVHLLYGFYIFSSAVAGDLSQTINDWVFKPNLAGGLKRVDSDNKSTNVDDLPPIVLVHGIFGFGKGVWIIIPVLIKRFVFFYWFYFINQFAGLSFYPVFTETWRFVLFCGSWEEGWKGSCAWFRLIN